MCWIQFQLCWKYILLRKVELAKVIFCSLKRCKIWYDMIYHIIEQKLLLLKNLVQIPIKCFCFQSKSAYRIKHTWIGTAVAPKIYIFPNCNFCSTFHEKSQWHKYNFFSWSDLALTWITKNPITYIGWESNIQYIYVSDYHMNTTSDYNVGQLSKVKYRFYSKERPFCDYSAFKILSYS